MAEEKLNPSQEPVQLDNTALKEGEKTVAQDETEALLATLEKLEIKTPERLENLAQSGQAYYTTAQRLGERNREIEELRREVEGLRQMSSTRQQYGDFEQPQYSAPIDLRGEIKSTLREFYADEILKPQQEAQAAYWQGMSYVKQSEHYPLVEDDWQDHLADPDVQIRLGQGQTTVEREFGNLVMRKYRNIALKARDTLQKMSGAATPGQTKPPHMEASTTESPARPEEQSDYVERLTETTKQWRGTDADIDRLMKDVLPDDDKLFGYGVEAAPVPDSKVGHRRKRR